MNPPTTGQTFTVNTDHMHRGHSLKGKVMTINKVRSTYVTASTTVKTETGYDKNLNVRFTRKDLAGFLTQ